MAHYLVAARSKGRLEALARSIISGQVIGLQSFGPQLDYSLRNARLDVRGFALVSYAYARGAPPLTPPQQLHEL